MKLTFERKIENAIDRFITHYAQSWMGDYDPDEVGEYLTEQCGQSFTGDYQITINITNGRLRFDDWPATRATFLEWRYRRTHPPKKNITKED